MKRQNGMWLSARAAATLLIMGAPTVLIPVQKHVFQTTWSIVADDHIYIYRIIALCLLLMASQDTSC